jgi:hypothetical protein
MPAVTGDKIRETDQEGMTDAGRRGILYQSKDGKKGKECTSSEKMRIIEG